MEGGKLKVWLPALRTGSGVDMFTLRLAETLERNGIIVCITWFSHRYETFPILLRGISPPQGTDIVIANSWNGFAFNRPGVPLVVIVHHSAYGIDLRPHQGIGQRLYHKFLIRPFERRSFKHANAISAVSDFSASAIKRHYPEITHIDVIPNWVDINRFRPAAISRMNGTPFRLLYVGKLSRPKGADMLEPIMRKLGEDFELLVAGNGSLPASTRAVSNIRLLGRVAEQNLIEHYQQCDALLLPSRSEGFSYAAIEAMACGKPVIATNTTALPEVIMNGVTGVLCPSDDAAAFADACRKLAADTTRREEMGIAARRIAEERFSEGAVIGRYISLIQRLANPATGVQIASHMSAHNVD